MTADQRLALSPEQREFYYRYRWQLEWVIWAVTLASVRLGRMRTRERTPTSAALLTALLGGSDHGDHHVGGSMAACHAVGQPADGIRWPAVLRPGARGLAGPAVLPGRATRARAAHIHRREQGAPGNRDHRISFFDALIHVHRRVEGQGRPARCDVHPADSRNVMRVVRWSVGFIVLVLGCASSASAQGWGREWMEKLSGPGPFEGIGLQSPVACQVEHERTAEVLLVLRDADRDDAGIRRQVEPAGPACREGVRLDSSASTSNTRPRPTRIARTSTSA